MLSLYDVSSGGALSQIERYSIQFNFIIGLFESAVHIDHVYLQNNPDIDKTYVKVLNKAFESCPTLLEFRDDHGNSIVHRTCELFIEHPVPLLLLQNMVDLVPIQLLLCKNSDGLSAADVAAAYSTVQVVNIVLCRIGLYQPLINPFCFLKSFYQRGDLLQVIEKMSFFVERDKSILRMRSSDSHHTILHQCLSIEDRNALLSGKLFNIPLFIVHMDPRSCQDIRRHSTYPATMGNRYLGEDDRLPILILMQRKDFVIDFSQPSWTTSSKFYGLFRTILNAYPPAASKKCWSEQKSLASMFSSVHDRFYRSPYEYALHHHFPEEYLRLLLNACPEIDNRMMRLFNYKARKVALMTGFNSMSSNMIPNVLFLIRMLHLHLFKKVVLYL
jgi:hypothetical protein